MKKRKKKLRHWLHARGVHRFCRITLERKVIGRSYDPVWLEGVNPKTGEAFRVDVSVFGGEPVYGETIEVHR
jgi:uncharacterized GH25 family protein